VIATRSGWRRGCTLEVWSMYPRTIRSSRSRRVQAPRALHGHGTLAAKAAPRSARCAPEVVVPSRPASALLDSRTSCTGKRDTLRRLKAQYSLPSADVEESNSRRVERTRTNDSSSSLRVSMDGHPGRSSRQARKDLPKRGSHECSEDDGHENCDFAWHRRTRYSGTLASWAEDRCATPLSRR
jgi:hypothetical protein